jgi:hypothetical protein
MKNATKLKAGVSMVIGLVVTPTILSLAIIAQTSESWVPGILIAAILVYLGVALYLMNSGWNGK